MKFYFIKTPGFLKLLFPQRVWSFSSSEKTLYLTFDDGPTPKITNWVLKELRKYNAKATFFCVGENISKYPTIYENIKNEKHQIGNHTYNHLNGFKTKTSEYLNNIETFHLKSYNNTSLFRPPYGKLTRWQALKLRKKGYKLIMWDVLSADFDATVSEENCLKNVITNVQNGSIIVFHDSLKSQEKLKFVLPKILEFYTNKGFQFKAIA